MQPQDTLTLTYGAWRAIVCPRLGGNVIALSHAGKDVLVPLKDEAQLEIDPYLQGAPILFPANRTNDAVFRFAGTEYTLPLNEPRTQCHLHGFVHRRPFTVMAQSDRAVTMRYTYDRPDEWFPFACEITVTYTLGEEGFTQTYAIQNLDSRALPAVFSVHSTFVQPERFVLPVLLKQEADGDRATGRYLPLNAQECRYTTGSPSRGVNAVGYFLASGHTATVGDYRYTVSDAFDHWVIYNGHGEADFLCVEPQCGCVNGLNEEGPNGRRIVAPGETLCFSTTISFVPDSAN